MFSAQAADSFGQVSPIRETLFTIDTAAPKFGIVVPPDGSLFRVPSITVAGGVDEAASIRLDGPGTSLSFSGQTFSFPFSLGEGANRLTLRATDAAGNAAEKSITYTLDSVAPKFTGITPVDGAVLTTASVALNGTVDESATIQLSGEGVSQSAQGTMFNFPVTLKTGVNNFTLTATDKAGNATNVVVRLTLQGASPKFATLTPSNGAVFAKSKVTIAGSLAEPANFKLTGDGVSMTARGDKFSFPVTLKPGANIFRVTGTTASGSLTEVDLTLSFVPVAVEITSPADATTTTDGSVIITGTYAGPPGTTVSVNDENAPLANGKFSLTVPLALGPNVLNVLAVSPESDGFAESRITIQRRSAEAAATITFDSPMNGATFVAPATIRVKAQARRADGSVIYGLKISNDSPSGFQNGVGESGFAEYEWRDVLEGTYEIAASVVDDNGEMVTKKVSVTVEPDPADVPLIAAWSGLKSALIAGDKTAALTYLTDTAKVKYGPVFDALMSHMPEIMATYSAPGRVYAGEQYAEFGVSRTVDGVNRIYLITFLRDENGGWKIDSM